MDTCCPHVAFPSQLRTAVGVSRLDGFANFRSAHCWAAIRMCDGPGTAGEGGLAGCEHRVCHLVGGKSVAVARVWAIETFAPQMHRGYAAITPRRLNNECVHRLRCEVIAQTEINHWQVARTFCAIGIPAGIRCIAHGYLPSIELLAFLSTVCICFYALPGRFVKRLA